MIHKTALNDLYEEVFTFVFISSWFLSTKIEFSKITLMYDIQLQNIQLCENHNSQKESTGCENATTKHFKH